MSTIPQHPEANSTMRAPNVPLPARALDADTWQPGDSQPYRVVFGAYRDITDDHDAVVSTSAVQWADGSIDDGRIEAPSLVILGTGAETTFSSDQARKLAAVLIEAAAELDGWAAR